MEQTYNFLIIGRCGSGKSATTRQLTGSDRVQVRNSPHSVTQTVQFYQSTPGKIEQTKVKFGVLDIPGLDEIGSRKVIRDTVLREMQQRKIDFDAILYTIDCVTRDVIDTRKIFHFLNELPWSLRDTRECLVPFVTKYDNLIYDAEDEQTNKTLDEFGKIFEQNNYGESWQHNHLYWINATKSIEKKMNAFNEIKEVYETQLQRLLRILSKKKTKLTREKIRSYLEKEDRDIQQKTKELIRNGQLVMRTASCVLGQQLTLELSRQKHTQNFTAAALGGVGMLLTKIVPNNIGKMALGIGAALAGCLIFRNLVQENSLIVKKQQECPQLKMRFDNTYIVEKVFEALSNNLRSYMQEIQTNIANNTLVIHIPDRFEGDYFTVFKSEVAECYLDETILERDKQGNFRMALLDDEQEKTVLAQLKLRFTVLVPEQHSLLEKFEQESYNFKKELDLM